MHSSKNHRFHPTAELARSRLVEVPSALIALAVAVAVSFLVAFSLYWNIANLTQQQLKLAETSAESNWNKDQVLRLWITRLGGFYVTPSERTPPNPYLKHLPHRDVVTTDGVELTLLNPAYMMSQMIREFDELYGVKGRITGKILLNPANKPDDWEFDALTRFEQGELKVVEQAQIAGSPYLRYMKPMFMTKGCVDCHGILGFKDGDLRGGVSVSIPLTPYLAAAREITQTLWITHGVVWIFSMLVILFFMRFAKVRRLERLSLVRQLEHDALHDSLTQLPNRVLFADRLEHAIARNIREQSYQFAVCFLDIDRFKNINDSYGHLVGDSLLKQIAARFQQVIRPGDTVARMGGDEFTFLMDGTKKENEAIVIAGRILESFRQPFSCDFGEVFMNASIGVCMSDPEYARAEQMLRDADIALYRAKAEGKGRLDIFNQEMHEKAKRVMQMENDLRQALEKGQMEVYFQPVVDIKNNRIAGFEALLRWIHPDLGFIPPDTFIPMAEDIGLINEIGHWVASNACNTVRDWNLEYSAALPFNLAVNLSGRQLIQKDIVESIKGVLKNTRFDPRLLHLEVTETAVIEHRQQAIKVIKDLKSLGISISVDDFGKGYSSLTYLQEFEFDTLKIDKDFVQDMGAEGKGLRLVKALMLLARDFELDVVAEGVEQFDQLQRLQVLGCKLIQGYYFSRPQPAHVITQILKRGGHKNASSLPGIDLNAEHELSPVVHQSPRQ